MVSGSVVAVAWVAAGGGPAAGDEVDGDCAVDALWSSAGGGEWNRGGNWAHPAGEDDWGSPQWYGGGEGRVPCDDMPAVVGGGGACRGVPSA
jgi:hypothetical protein